MQEILNSNYEKPIIEGSLGWSGMVEDENRYCHSHVNNGMISFLTDSQHEFKGQTLELPEII